MRDQYTFRFLEQAALLGSSTLKCSPRVWPKVMLKTLTVPLVQIYPALGQIGVGVREYLGVEVLEGGGHADNCLGKCRGHS